LPRSVGRTALDPPPLRHSSTTPTERPSDDCGRAANRSGLHRYPSRQLPTPVSGPLHRPYPQTSHSTLPHSKKSPTHHRTRPSSSCRRGWRGSTVDAPANGLRSRWIPPPPRRLGLRWTPPPVPPPPLPTHALPLPDPHTPLHSTLRAVVDLTQPVYRKVFLTPGTKGFPPDRTRFVTKPRQPNSHTFTRASGYVAYSSQPPIACAILPPPPPDTVSGSDT